MTLIGMLHYRKHPGNVKKAYAYAAVSKMEGVDFFYFSYSCVDFNTKKITGWVYQNGKWTKRIREFPRVVINISGPRTKQQSMIKKRLAKEVTFTSYPVGNKMQVYKKVLSGKKFADHLIPSSEVTNVDDVCSYLKSCEKAVLKPFSGHHGQNIMFLIKKQEKYEVIEGTDKYEFDQPEFEQFLKERLDAKKYLIQPYIKSVTKAGLTFDFRLHVQKNGKGEWEITLIYPRISGNTKMISNISSGGYRGELVPFLKEEYGSKYEEIKRNLEEFAIHFSNHFDTLYAHPFDEIGIDVGMDDQYKLWVFEVNWRPGSKQREFEVAKRLIPYSVYLANR